jgi:tRNA-dihydrouridine synthase B
MPLKIQRYPAGPVCVNIGPVHLETALALAPMAGVTSHPLRYLAREYGCGLVFSEMIHARALLHESGYSNQLSYFHEAERPVGLQLFGSEPGLLAEAAQRAEGLGADLVDLNFGCPASRIVRNGEGGALLRQPKRCSAIFKAVTGIVTCPVTVKLRKGWDDHLVNAVEIAERAEEAGVKAVTVHGRTVVQGLRGKADWGIVRKVKAAVGIPVFGNGDITSADNAAAMREYTGCDGVMIGRAALGNPWIFEEVKARFQGRPAVKPPAPQERVRTALRHLDLLFRFKGGDAAMYEMRRAAGWYLKGFPRAALVRRSLERVSTVEGLKRVLKNVFLQEEHYLGGG